MRTSEARTFTLSSESLPLRSPCPISSEEGVEPQRCLIPTAVSNLQLLSGAQDLLSAADTKNVQRQRLLRSIRSLEADYILVDLGAGNSLSVLDFFLMSDGGILVVTPEPTSMENAYRFLKKRLLPKIATVVGFLQDPAI